MSTPPYFRSWMDGERMNRETNLLNEEYANGVMEFMELACRQPRAQSSRKLTCPCSLCRNNHHVRIDIVWNHLYMNGFLPSYKVWYLHGERPDIIASSSGSISLADRIEEPRTELDVGEPRTELDVGAATVQMVNDVYRENIETAQTSYEEPNLNARQFFDMLDAANQPLYSGCRDGHSPLSSASRLMGIKTDYNLPEDAVDAIAKFVRDILPEDNNAPCSYYEVQKLVAGLGLPYQVIDVCIDNCMIYWRRDAHRENCRYCRKPRYKDTGGRVSVPYKRMWYLPLTDRLKRLYQSERTAAAMRWHAEHRFDGEITHPSDAEAWRHFKSTYPDFACETRNVYLGLSTDGFSPFGKHGRQYSLWPVIVTPYNLPPLLCMNREFLFLSVLVPGPEHPKRSLDVFLQPLIYELQTLWNYGEEVYDVSLQQNFKMRAVLMWTISDFPAYGMLSGWTTHGKLACPYCNDNTESFQLKNGRKTCWFDCHRRFLPPSHPYRRSTTLFTKKKCFDGPPPELDGTKLLAQMEDYGVEMTNDANVGGNGHVNVEYAGINHNWHKKSIFWELPYWKTHLLRHNLDVMHIEKNFFDNIMNTVLNVQGKTKDNFKSRLDLVDICSRSQLHITDDGVCPIPAFRLSKTAKAEFFDWIIHKVKFPDGYASNLRNCIDIGEGKFVGMKSHDCHVVMQRLLPFAFQHLLPPDVHEAIAAVGAFFRDINRRTLTADSISTLQRSIPMILCDLEKIFPPSFFDVMEHLTVHLPREAALGGPVQYRWMYPFERYMFHLKKKVKNLSRVEGSIVAQSINEEAAHFAEYYFPRDVATRSRRTSRHDDGGQHPIYPAYVPSLFQQIGRLSGKGKNRQLTAAEWKHLHTYILSNCEDAFEYERIYMAMVRGYFPHKSEDEIESHKQEEYHKWLQYFIREETSVGRTFPTWLLEIARGPNNIVTSYPRYCTRGFAFKVQELGRERTTLDHGISSTSGDVVYYGILREILEVKYSGMLNMRCVVFMCDWYDPTDGRGVNVDKFGVTTINSRRKLGKYDPFILASQADQVSYIRYPRISGRNDPWITVTQINPRRMIDGVYEHEPLQPIGDGSLAEIQPSMGVNLVVDLTMFGDLDVGIHDVDEESGDEFGDDTDSAPSDYSSSSE